MVSIVIVTYNYGHFIAEALESVVSQSYGDFECIIIDNGSVDNTQTVVLPFLADRRFTCHLITHTNVSVARNEALKKVKGNYVMFLDSDDMIEREKLKVSVSFLDTNANVGLVYSDMRYFKHPDSHKLYRNYSCNDLHDKSWMPYFSGSGVSLAALILNGNIMVISSPVFRTDILRQIGLFDTDLGYNEDWELWMRMALHGVTIQYLNAPLSMALIRIHQSSLSRDVFKMQVFGLKVLLKHQHEYKLIGLEKRFRERVDEHFRAIKASLGKSDYQTFRTRIYYLLEHHLGHVLPAGTRNMFLLHLTLKFQKIFSR